MEIGKSLVSGFGGRNYSNNSGLGGRMMIRGSRFSCLLRLDLWCALFIPVLLPTRRCVCVVCAAAAAAFLMPPGEPFSFGFKKDYRKDCRKKPALLGFGDEDHGIH